MIPFYIFRKGVISPVASVYHSGLIDNLDFWACNDRMEIVDEIRAYSKRYALDWLLTIASALLLGTALGVCLALALGLDVVYPDMTLYLLVGVLSYCLPYSAMEHILNQYVDALELNGGKLKE